MKEWQRPKTTRLYLHPPKSEDFYTLWREGKFIFGECVPALGAGYFGIVSAGLWFVKGDESLDFRTAEYVLKKDGVPVHGLVNKVGDFDMEIEAFATPGRKSVCYIKVVLKNCCKTERSERFGFILRTGKECELVFAAPDVYAPYAPDITVWKNMKSTWQAKGGGIFTDGERILKTVTDINFDFDDNGVASAEIKLPSNGSKEIIFAYGLNGSKTPDYFSERENTEKFWQKELRRINKLPESIEKDPLKSRMIKNLTVQLLQCFCTLKGTNLILARQGGLQRQMWTYESMPVLEALARIGDFDDYIEPVIEAYFRSFQTDTGEVVPMGIHWGMVTGNALYSFARYAALRGEDYYNKYRVGAFKAFEWIKNTRRAVIGNDEVVAGLFPPKRSCDDPLEFQSWTLTDAFNVFGISEFLKTAEIFNDARVSEIKEEFDEYRGAIIAEYRKISERYKNCDEIDFPLSPRISNEVLLPKYEFNVCAATISDIAEASDEDIGKILRYGMRRGKIYNGLYDRMPDKNQGDSVRYNLGADGKCKVWYVCNHEYYWFKLFLKRGKRERLCEILEANEKYAMTDEYYMTERYDMQNPWFAPWMPNASANGRTILMTLDFYG